MHSIIVRAPVPVIQVPWDPFWKSTYTSSFDSAAENARHISNQKNKHCSLMKLLGTLLIFMVLHFLEKFELLLM